MKHIRGNGGELHPIAGTQQDTLTTDQGLPIADDQNSLKGGERGPTLLEDFVLREKITHFDHERIPERVVHARGYGVHGTFRSSGDHSALTAAAFLGGDGVETPVFVRFSTVVGNKGSFDLARDVRGFATKFYTSQGNFDLVGNNIPVFFIQDAMKFPDLVHAVKQEPDRGFPQAGSAHDTFWDFIAVMPESMHMVMWVMSDRALPRSYRMMEGFGVNTFRFVTADGTARFVKFHWRPGLGAQSVLWDEASKINGADPDFHRRDLWEAIERGDAPTFELSVQVLDDALADALDFDILDASKVVPEEIVPRQVLGVMTLDRNVEEFFAETEQVAFCPSHLVPGIDFSEDPLLQGRLFSYLDTQLKRLGGPNFAQIPVNRPQCPMHNMHRGGHMQMRVPARSRVSYSPSAELGSSGESPEGFQSAARPVSGTTRRLRPESFADHYSQARMFFRSMTAPEQDHIVEAFVFELGKVETVAIRRRMLGHLTHVDPTLCARVGAGLGMAGQEDPVEAAVPVRDLPPSPALSLLGRAVPTLQGRKVGVLVTADSDDDLVAEVRDAAEAAGATVQLVAPEVGGAGGRPVVDHALRGAPSVLFDAVVLAPGPVGVKKLCDDPDAVEWVCNAWRHLKVIGHTDAAGPLLAIAGVAEGADAGVVAVDASTVGAWVKAAETQRIWDRDIPRPKP